MSSRFGKSPALAALVTVIALTAGIPYLALQYKAVGTSIDVLTGSSAAHPAWFADPALGVALLMALFAALFGTRQIDATEHHEGVMLAIAFESLVKLLAFVAVGVFAESAVGADRLQAELCQARAKAFRMPSAGVEPTQDPVTMICRIRWGCTTVPRGIAEPAGGDDVVGAIVATVLARDEVLGRALEPGGLPDHTTRLPFVVRSPSCTSLVAASAHYQYVQSTEIRVPVRSPAGTVFHRATCPFRPKDTLMKYIFFFVICAA